MPYKDKETRNAKQREWYQKNKEQEKIRHQKDYQENKEKRSAKNKEWKENNKEKNDATDKIYREKNKDGINERGKNHYQQNIERERGKRTDYRNNHKKEGKARQLLNDMIASCVEPFVMEECDFCGKPSTMCHHENYDLPFFIYFSCRGCHISYHNMLSRE